jgi:hypothetical protein
MRPVRGFGSMFYVDTVFLTSFTRIKDIPYGETPNYIETLEAFSLFVLLLPYGESSIISEIYARSATH